MTRMTADQLIDAELAELEALKQKCEEWRTIATAAQDAGLATGLPWTEWGLENPPVSWRLSINAAAGSGAIPGVLFLISDVRDLRADVVPALRELRRRGFAVKEFDDWADLKVRTYRMVYAEGGMPVPLTVRAFLYDKQGADAICRFEKVGEETVPVMKIVCDGEIAPEIAAAEASGGSDAR